MMEKLCQKDFTGILINIMYVKLLLAVPLNIILIAGNASWILCIVATLIMLGVFCVITKIYTFCEPITEIKSKPLRIIMAMLISAVLLLSMSSVAKIYPETIKIILLNNTPIELIFLIVGLASVAGAYIGIKPLGRIASLFQPVALIIMLMCLVFLTPHMHFSNITPILDNGLVSFEGLTTLSAFSDIFLLFIIPSETKHIKSIGYKVIIIMGIIMTITILAYCLIYPHNISQSFVFPIYQMVRLIQVGEFFGRFEAFFEFIWSVSIFIYFSVYLYALSIVWQKAFELEYSKPLLAPFMILLSLIVYNSASYTELSKNYIPYSTIIIVSTTLIPVICSIIKKREERKINK